MTHSYNTRYQKKIAEGWARISDGRGPGDMKSVPNLSEFLAVERALAAAAREAMLTAVRRAEQRYSDQGMCDLCEEKPVRGFHLNNYDAVCEDCMNC